MRRGLPLMLIGALVLSGSCLALFKNVRPAQGADSAPVAPLVPVTAQSVERHDVPLYLTGLGTAQAFNTVAVSPQVDGQLIKIVFVEGQDVHAGDILAQIDPRSYQAALDQAVAQKAQHAAQLANARLDADRYASLVERNYISRQQLDTTRAQIAQFEAAIKGDDAAIDAARVQLGYTTVRSPIDGRVGIRQIDVGNVVHSDSVGSSGSKSGSGGGSSSSSSSGGGESQTLVVVTQEHPIAVVFTLPQEHLRQVVQSNVKARPEVTVFERTGAQALDHGHLAVIDNQIDPASNTVKIKAIFPNKNGVLWPGQFVTAKVLVDTHVNALTVPASAVQKSADKGDFVYVVRDGDTVEARPVATGAIANDITEITDGLRDGDIVVTGGQFRLRPGSKVAVTTAAQKTAVNGPAP